MAVGLGNRAATVRCGKARHIVHLQANAVTDAVREERAGHAAGKCVFRRYLDHAKLAQHAGQQQVRLQMDVCVIGAGAHVIAQCELRCIDGADHRGKFVIGGGIGTGDVAGVAAEAGPGIDQKTAHRFGRHTVTVGVVQHCAVFIEGHDIAVGQVIGVLAGGLAIGQVDAELAGTGAEGALGGTVRTHADAAGLPHHFDFIRRFEGAVIFQILHNSGRIIRDHIAQCALQLAYDCATGEVLRQMHQHFVRRANGDDVEVFHPVATGCIRHHMPVIMRLQKQQLGALAGADQQPTAGRAGEWQPRFKLRVDRVRIVAVIKGLVMQRAAGDQQMREAAALQGFGAARQQGVNVLRVQRGKRG